MLANQASAELTATSHAASAWSRRLPWVVFGICLLATFLLWRYEQHNAEQELRTEFDFRVRVANSRIEQRMQAYEQVLRGVAGLFTHASNVSRQEFHNYFERLHLEENYPGIQGLTFSRIVPLAQKDRHIAALHAEGFREYDLMPPGKRESYAPVVYVEPFSGRNLRAFGHDPYADPVRRAAMERARDLDQASISGKVRLVQETERDVQAGFVMYLPIYNNAAPHESLADRRANIVGWVAAPFRMGDLMPGLINSQSSLIDFEIYDDAAMSEQALMYDSDDDPGSRINARFQIVRPVTVAGHAWTVAARSHAEFEERLSRSRPHLIAYTGFAISLLLAWLSWLLASSRARALKAAREMNHELLESKTRYQQMFDDAASIAFLIDPDNGRIADANAAAAAFWGYSPEKLRSMNIAQINTASREEIRAAMDKVRNNASNHLEWCHRLKSGEIRDVEVYSSPLTYQGKTLLFSILHDITERKSADRLLHIEKQFSDSIINSLPGIFYMFDTQGKFIRWNLRFEEVSGYSKEELMQLQAANFFDGEEKRLLANRMYTVFAAGEANAEGEFLTKNGRKIPYYFSGRRANVGGMVYLVGLGLDISERKQAENMLREQKTSLAAMIEGALDAAILMSSTGVIISWNPQAEKIFGWTEEEAIGRTLHETIIPPRYRHSHVLGLGNFLSSGNSSMLNSRVEALAVRRSGQEFPIELSITPLKMEGKQEFSAFIRDITERRKREEELRLAATVFETVDEAVIITDTDNKIVSVNRAFTSITGYSREEVIGKNPHVLSSGKHPPEFYQELWGSLTATGSWHGEVWNRRKVGDIYIEQLSIHTVRDAQGRLTHHVGTFSDISERKAAEEHVRHMAHYDLLTGLPNRTLIADRLRQTLIKAKRDKGRVALMFLDLDQFKPVNDTFGHATGDWLLKEVAQRLLHCVRESDTVARIGGDEFVVLLPVIEDDLDATTVAEKILHALSQPFQLDGHTLQISSSIGIAIYPDHGDDEDLLIRNADIAMYRAKSSGRNNAKIYRPSMPGDN